MTFIRRNLNAFSLFFEYSNEYLTSIRQLSIEFHETNYRSKSIHTLLFTQVGCFSNKLEFFYFMGYIDYNITN